MGSGVGDLVTSGAIADLVLIFMLCESVALSLWLGRKRAWRRLGGILPGLAGGALLVLALRAEMTDAGWLIVVACIAAWGVGHAFDLYFRLRRS